MQKANSILKINMMTTTPQPKKTVMIAKLKVLNREAVEKTKMFSIMALFPYSSDRLVTYCSIVRRLRDNAEVVIEYHCSQLIVISEITSKN